jgi:hypothetical protein
VGYLVNHFVRFGGYFVDWVHVHSPHVVRLELLVVEVRLAVEVRLEGVKLAVERQLVVVGRQLEGEKSMVAGI